MVVVVTFLLCGALASNRVSFKFTVTFLSLSVSSTEVPTSCSIDSDIKSVKIGTSSLQVKYGVKSGEFMVESLDRNMLKIIKEIVKYSQNLYKFECVSTFEQYITQEKAKINIDWHIN